MTASAQYPGALIDVKHYRFDVELSDKTDSIRGTATIQFNFLKNTDYISIDLISQRSDGKGMKVISVTENEKPLEYSHTGDVIRVRFSAAAKPSEKKTIQVKYQGVPADGLIIAKNKYNHRTFFSDHWPNRARNWLPCIDHPSDKATIEFMVTAPLHYQVVSNGAKIEETNLDAYRKFTHYREDIPLPMKIASIGVADFAVRYEGEVGGIPIQSWVYPEERKMGFYDYGLATEMLPYFLKKLGSYPYYKLANVQSRTIYGGMENAGAIFYAENAITGNRHMETLMAHEIGHQWFGDMVTEADYAHVWLSEGFATYLAITYMENKYGNDTASKMRIEDRSKAIAFAKQKSGRIVDSSTTNYLDLLNANVYQKGGWVLHMLRRQLGDSVFWNCLRSYYSDFGGRNAITDDFRKVVEKISGRDQKKFFQQWLFTNDHPKLTIQWKYNAQANQVTINIDQLQSTIFEFPIDIKIAGSNNNDVLIRRIDIKDRKTETKISLSFNPSQVLPDPAVDLFYEGKTERN